MMRVFASGCFDNLGAIQVRFLEEAAKLGPLTVFLRDDDSAAALLGHAAIFPFEERRYFLEALRYVRRVEALGRDCPPGLLPKAVPAGSVWAMPGGDCQSIIPVDRSNPLWLSSCIERGCRPLVLGAKDLEGFPYEAPPLETAPVPGKKKAMVTGSFDWLHTGHVRFFEEASDWGELTVVVGHDANIRLLKGEGHPFVPEAERLYMVASIRHVARALVSSGSGWLDAEPEIARLKPDRYIVNADGDKGDKRHFCEEAGIEYIVLAREPKPGLPRRSSTDLRGF